MSAKVFHIPLVQVTPQFTLHSIVQRNPVPSNDAGADHPNVKIYNSYDAILADPAVDIIIITTTPETHFSFTQRALEAGKHVLVEKPFVPTAAEADTLIALAKKQGKLICVYQNRRWDADFLTFRNLQKKGTLGRIVEFNTHFDRYKAQRPDTWKGQLGMEHAGGVLYDLGTHLIDQVVVAFGVPKTVTAVFANQRGDGAEEPDSITVLLGYGKEGPLCTVKAGVMSVESEQPRFWVRGTKGSWRKQHLDVQEDQLKAGQKPGDEGFGIESEDRAGWLCLLGEGGQVKGEKLPNVVPETYGALYKGFAEAVDGGGEGLVPVKASEARDVLRVIEAARESDKTGRTVEL